MFHSATATGWGQTCRAARGTAAPAVASRTLGCVLGTQPSAAGTWSTAAYLGSGSHCCGVGPLRGDPVLVHGSPRPARPWGGQREAGGCDRARWAGGQGSAWVLRPERREH